MWWQKWAATAVVVAVAGSHGASVEEGANGTKYLPSASNALSNPHRLEC
jgi:hypothetical protein